MKAQQNTTTQTGTRSSITIGELCLAISDGLIPAERLFDFYAVRDVDVRRGLIEKGSGSPLRVA
ncbi:MAG: hypothetical protein HY329_04060 [Chloroflexi bacterium]|nr:hypothetical protein [Chloroflexota bacterium]